MNNCYHENLDKDFVQALKTYEKNYTREELISLLQNGNILQRQICALKLDTIKSALEAEILVSNLTGQNGKIREAVSFRLEEFMSCSKTLNFFRNPQLYKIFLDAVSDINPNVCRNVISSISNLENDAEFCSIFCPKLTEKAINLLDTLEKFDTQCGKYKINKEVFKLYWTLETIYIFYDKVPFEDLKNILLRSKNSEEYTIREKTAQILSRDFEDKELTTIRRELKNDENYYVRII